MVKLNNNGQGDGPLYDQLKSQLPADSKDREPTCAFGIMDDRIVMQFDRQLGWIGFTPDQAQRIGTKMIELAGKHRGKPVNVRISLKEDDAL